ncbi:MAG: hypothetical protein QNJ53_28900 [Pleurocapsa sp. MO_192.B19]|nr:hypothetical protein [Pleurocapsa sp. MO_192.B19]
MRLLTISIPGTFDFDDRPVQLMNMGMRSPLSSVSMVRRSP